MGKAAAKPKTAPGKDVVKKAAKRVNKAAAAKSSAEATAKAAAKVKVEPPSPQRSPRVEEIVPVSQAATVDKKDISNFLGQMKRASSDDAVALYNHYKTLGKFDAQKQALVAKWKADKSCKWYSSYSESFEKTSASKKQGAVGWSTRPAGDQSLFFPLLLLIPLPSSGGKLPMRCIEIQAHHLSRNFWTLWKAALRSGMSLCRKKSSSRTKVRRSTSGLVPVVWPSLKKLRSTAKSSLPAWVATTPKVASPRVEPQGTLPEYTWYIKPKFHGMAELALAFDNPSMNWVYRDEEAGGTLARLGRSKGNLQTPWSVSINVLQRFAAEFSVPAF